MPTAAILDARTLQSTPESGAGGLTTARRNGRARRSTSPVDTLGYCSALRVTPANEQERAVVGQFESRAMSSSALQT
jgi:hypothetical protein